MPGSLDELREWLRVGHERGWVSDVYCAIHDGPRLTDEEEQLVDQEDGDLDAVCAPCVRIWQDAPS